MNYFRKNQILDLLNTVNEMVSILHQLKNQREAIADCQLAIETIMTNLQQEFILPETALKSLTEFLHNLSIVSNDISINNSKYHRKLKQDISLIRNILKEEIPVKLNVAFFPYKASMWDSLATIYEAAANDPNCIAKVVPIPYYELEHNSKRPAYEGGLFPKNIPIIHYSQYDLVKERPDIIFVHNVYDQYNTITQVYEHYFTENLKKYTDMLVFVPYHISSPIELDKNDTVFRLAYNLPTIKNVDKIVLAGTFVEHEALIHGIPKNKILTLGSPKFDSMLNALNEEKIPDEWQEIIAGKLVLLLNTGCMFFNDPRSWVTLDLVFDITRYVDNTALIWRPHPLTQAAVQRYMPQQASSVDTYFQVIKSKHPHMRNTILDQEVSYFSALKAADVLVSGFSSILDSYLISEKKVIFFSEKMPEKSLIPANAFYYFFDPQEPWFELVKKMVQGYDPLAKNRKGLVSKIYKNLDGTCGEKIYQKIKDHVLRKQNLL